MVFFASHILCVVSGVLVLHSRISEVVLTSRRSLKLISQALTDYITTYKEKVWKTLVSQFAAFFPKFKEMIDGVIEVNNENSEELLASNSKELIIKDI